jgi:membrane fusion protein, multidrug efflux system
MKIMNREILTTEKPREDVRNGSPAQNGSESGPKPRMKWALLLIPVILIAAGYFVYTSYFANRESTDDAQIDGHINPVAAKVSGNVIALNVRDNESVKAGTVVVNIDPRDYQVVLDRAQADLAAAESVAAAAHTQVPITSTSTSSQVNLADASIEHAQGVRAVAAKEVETARAKLTSAQARVRETQATYTKVSQDLERMKMLITKDEISKQQFDAAVAAAAAARAAQDAAQAAVDEQLKSIEAAQARVVEADAGVKQAIATQQATKSAPQQMAVSRSNAQTASARVKLAQAALAQARLNMEYTEVKAPIDGVISQRRVELGQYVQTGQPLMAIIGLHDVWITANYKENQLRHMRPGQKAVVTVDAYGGRKFEGHVDSIAAATGARFSLLPPENATGNYVKVVQRVPLKIVIDKGVDAEHPLRPGLSVICTVFVDEN